MRANQIVAFPLILLCLAAAPPDQPQAQDAPAAHETTQGATQGHEVKAVPAEQAISLLGRPVNDPEGKQIGRLVDVLVDENGRPQAAVIDFGGFLGVGNRRIAVHWSTLQFVPTDTKQPVIVDMTPDQLRAAPQYAAPDKTVKVVTPASPVPEAEPGPAAGRAPPAN